MKQIIIAILGLILIGGVSYYLLKTNQTDYDNNDDTNGVLPVEPDGGIGDGAQPLPETGDEERKPLEIIGKSVNGRDITAYHYGKGETEVLFVGGIHGGYSWNTTLLAYELMDYLEDNPELISENLTVTVIPALNPDGLEKVTGKDGRFESSDVNATDAERIVARFNANDVDLNRNFDCQWESKGTWQNRTVSGGGEPFSEPESESFRNYIDQNQIGAVVVWYSSAGGVYSSNCNNGVLPETKSITNIFAKASGYTAHEEFDYYEITGDMVNWLAKEKIPAISVLLTDHKNTDWNKNEAGVKALLEHYAE